MDLHARPWSNGAIKEHQFNLPSRGGSLEPLGLFRSGRIIEKE
jgi:hypothetical protein